MNTVFRSTEGKSIIMRRYEEILTYWPAPNEQLTIPTSYGDTFVMASGKEGGDAVVLLHGSMTNAAMWLGDVPVLGKTRRVYAVDIIGESGKSAENRPRYKGTHYALWLSELFDGLGLKSTAVVGNSLGGWMAISLAAYAPLRVSQLVLLAPAGISPIHMSFLLEMAVHTAIGKNRGHGLNKRILGNLMLPDEAVAFAGLLGQYFRPRRPDKLRPFPDETFSRLKMPVLFFGGEKDILFSTQKSADRLKRLVPQADIRILKDAPHTLINLGGDIAAFLDAHQ
ncbi:MAG: alpha/beta hydrolase [Eubacteriales bacterium]|nr:alpha/beta hydrolase [Eubacteriales bacterium]